jgi:protein phosphatase PTC7
MPPESERDNVLHDQVEDAETSTINLEIGDIILTATDGLFDNVPDSIILQELAKIDDVLYHPVDNRYESIKQTAWSIAQCARDLSYDPDYMSPFAKKARKSGYNVTGGKVDDITLLLSMVTPE